MAQMLAFQFSSELFCLLRVNNLWGWVTLASLILHFLLCHMGDQESQRPKKTLYVKIILWMVNIAQMTATGSC